MVEEEKVEEAEEGGGFIKFEVQNALTRRCLTTLSPDQDRRQWKQLPGSGVVKVMGNITRSSSGVLK